MARKARSEPNRPTASLGWLAAVLPASARRFRVADPEVADALVDAGGELVGDQPDVEIVSSAEHADGDAALAVVAVDPPVRGSRFLAVRLSERLAASVHARVRAERARRGLQRRGYHETSVLRWDVRQRVTVQGAPAHRPQLVERLPAHALAIGRRADTGSTALEAVLADASGQVGTRLELRWASIRSGILLAETNGGILRVAIGPGRVQILNQAAALERLGAGSPAAAVADRVPWLVARGRVGLADWSLERRLPGTMPTRALAELLADECYEFLVALHRAPGGDVAGRTAAEIAETAASVCGPEEAERVRSLADRLDVELAGLPRGFGHGDFFAGNLLAADGRLTGVLDWDAAGPGRLPLGDLFHLQLTRGGYGTDNDWGPSVLKRLLPGARGGGDDQVRRYCRDIGLDPDARVLEGLVLSYWLGYVAYQLRTHPARRFDPLWIERNVEDVVRQVEPQAGAS